VNSWLHDRQNPGFFVYAAGGNDNELLQPVGLRVF